MKFPMVMPSNIRTIASPLSEQYPNRLGLLLSPGGWADPSGLPYALDNGRYVVWSKGLKWNEGAFFAHLDRAANQGRSPLWVAVPDVVGDAQATITEWGRWAGDLLYYGWPLAIVVQDGMFAQDVKPLRPKPDVVFIGGTTRWKWRTLRYWTKVFQRVHVGRVNTYRMLWTAHRAGVESTDGTGWWHHKQRRQLETYLERSEKGLGQFKFKGHFFV